MKQWIFILTAMVCLGGFSQAQAQSFTFENLTSADVEKVIDEFSSNFAFTSVSSASALGSIFGFEVALVGGMTTTPELDSLVSEGDSSSSAESIPHGHLLFRLTVPAGITAELGYLPEIGDDNFKFNNIGLGVKWTISEIVPLPFDLAVRAHYSTLDIEIREDVNSVDTTLELSNTIMGLQAFASIDLMFVQPYFGLGFIQGDGNFDVTGNTTDFFGGDLSGEDSASSTQSSTQIILGAEFRLMILNLGLEYTNQFGTNRYTAKAGLSF